MIELAFAVLMIVIFAKILILAIKMTWNITKIIFTVVFLPAALVCLVLAGFLWVAFPILILIGIVLLLHK